MSAERRVAKRVPSKFEVAFIHTGDYLISQSRDISADGMFLHTSKPPKKGDTTRLKFKLTEGISLEVEAVVIWANTEDASKDKGMAVQFIKTTKEEKDSILEYIRKIAILDETMTHA